MSRQLVRKSNESGLVIPKGQAARHPVAVYLASLSRGSRRSQMVALRSAIAAMSGRDTSEVRAAEVGAFGWTAIRFEHVTALRTALGDSSRSAAYANKCLAAVRGVLRTAWRLGLMSRDDMARAVDVPPVRGESALAGRHVTAGEIAALMAACSEDDSPSGVRDAAMIALAVTQGPRVSELAAFRLDDFDPESGRLDIRHGKGNKARTVWAANGALEALRDWIDVRGPEPGGLFVPVDKAGAIKVTESGLSATALQNRLNLRAKQARVEPVAWHSFRRTATGNLLDAGADLVTVQKTLGHADPRTTARYDRRPEQARKAAAATLHVPYRSRRKRAKGKGSEGGKS